MDSKFLQPEKVPKLIQVIPSGITIDFNAVQSAKARLSIFFNVLGNVTDSKFLQSINACSHMCVTPSGITIDFNEDTHLNSFEIAFLHKHKVLPQGNQ